MQIKDVMYPEKYTTGPHNDEKTKWHNVGTLFIKDDGKMSLKLTMLPVNFDGNLMVFDRKPKEQGGYQHAPQQPHQAQRPGAYDAPSDMEFDGEIPF